MIASSRPMTLLEIKNAATDCYIYGYPLVLSSIAARAMSGAKLNRFFSIFDEELERSVGHSGLIISSAAWVDVGSEPIVLSVPADRRYYAASFFDAWTNPFQSVGLRVTSVAPHAFVLVAKGYSHAPLPANCTQIDAPTALVRIGVRVAAYSDADLQSAVAFQRRFELLPLSRFLQGEREISAFGPVMPSQEEIVNEIEGLAGAEFFSRMSLLLRDNPPLPLDTAMRESMDHIGIGSADPAWPGAISAEGRAAADRGARLGKARIQSYRAQRMQIGEWFIDQTCQPASARDYVRRSAIARERLYTDVPQDYVRLITEHDAGGDALDGRFHYTLTFDRVTEPPARGPWFVSTRPSLRAAAGTAQRNANGSIGLHFGRNQPIDLPHAQYFPVRAGPFSVVLHVFWPEDAILNGGWLPPSIELLR